MLALRGKMLYTIAKLAAARHDIYMWRPVACMTDMFCLGGLLKEA